MDSINIDIKYKEYEDTIHLIFDNKIDHEIVEGNAVNLNTSIVGYFDKDNKISILEIPKSLLYEDLITRTGDKTTLPSTYSKEVDALSIRFKPQNKNIKCGDSVLCNEELFQYDFILHLSDENKLVSIEILFIDLYINKSFINN